MSNVPTSVKYNFTPLTEDEGHKLFSFGVRVKKATGKYPSIFGASKKQNDHLASAYSKNKEMYPAAYWVSDKLWPEVTIAFVLVTNIPNTGIDIDVVSNCVGDQTELINEIKSDVYRFVNT